ncbi:MAG TPA: DMT family transporter [Thermoplasmata archaeon]|nr:DMT family transporter [Thermoplasmata archaeon]
MVLGDSRGPLNRRNKYIAIVLFSAIVVAYEAVAVEGALNTANLDIFLVTAMPSIAGGLMLIAFRPRATHKLTMSMDRRQWSYILLLSLVASVGVFTWYDAIARIGASKEAILGGGSSEVLFVVILSALFLGEKLNRWEIFGGFLILMGVFFVLVNRDILSLTLGTGEIEAIAGSFFLASSVVMVTKMLREYDIIPVLGMELLLSGIMLLIIGLIAFPIVWPDAVGWIILIALGIFPPLSITTYFAGTKGIGASLTSVLFSLNGILTIVAQLSVLIFIHDANVKFPENMVLAIVGGVIAFFGVYLIEENPTKHGPKVDNIEHPH